MNATAETTRILLVDDHPVYLDGIAVILEGIFGNVDIISVENAERAIEVVTRRSDLDWIFVDYKLPDCDGLILTKRLNDLFVTAPIIMMTGMDEVALISQAIDTGVSGFIHKASGKTVFRDCINAIEAGEAYIAPEQKLALNQYKGSDDHKNRERILEQLSSRRKDVLLLIAEGYSNSEIAETLSISETTVKAHVSALISILDADNRYHCVAEARKMGIL